MDSRRFFAAQAAMLLCTCSGAALAQSVTIPEPAVRSTTDENGINLATGKIELADPGVTIGVAGSGGLSHQRVWMSNGWRHGFFLTVTTVGSRATVSIGGSSSTFTQTGGGYISDQGNGATLTADAASFIYTMADGTVVTFDRNLAANNASYYGTVAAVGTAIVSPTGERTTLTYRRESYLYAGSAVVYVLRLQSVNNNLGYQLHYNYFDSALSQSSVDNWVKISGVQAINNANDYCDPNAITCNTLTLAWPAASYSYAPSGSNIIESKMDSMGYETRYTTDSGGRLIGIRRPSSASDNLSIEYDGQGRVGSVFRDYGSEWAYNWSQNGNSLTGSVWTSQGSGRSVTSDTDKQVVTSMTDEFNQITHFGYDAYGRRTLVTAPEGNKTQTSYDARGNVVETRLIAKTPGAPADIVTTASYDVNCVSTAKCNRPNWTRDPNGNYTDYSYDGTTGNLLSVTSPAVNGVRPQVRNNYQPLQASFKNSSGAIVSSGIPISRLLSSSRCRTLASCAGGSDETITTFGYSANLLPTISITTAGNGGVGQVVSTTYDAIGNVWASDGPMNGSADAIRYRYDSNRRVVGVIGPDPDGAGVRMPVAVRNSYNQEGQLLISETGTVNSQSDSDWATFSPQQRRVRTYQWGFLSTEAVTDAGGGTQYQLTQHVIDSAGRTLCVVQRMNAPNPWSGIPGTCDLGSAGAHGNDRITRYFWQGFNRLSQVYSAFGTSLQQVTETYTYTANGKQASVTDANNNRTQYNYDGFDRLTVTNYPVTTTGAGASSPSDYEQYAYDANGNLTWRRLRDGQANGYGYDALNRLTGIDRPNTAYWETDIGYAYDNMGNLTAGWDSNGRHLSFGYDALGRKTSQGDNWYGWGNASMQYDEAGHMTRYTWGDGAYVSYNYFNDGQMSAIRDAGGNALISFDYDSLGRRSTLWRANGTSTSYSYDPASRLSQLTQNLAGTGNDLSVNFAYSPANDITIRNSSNDAYAWNGYVSVNRGYGVNGLNQQTSAGSVGFSYDGRGNLTNSGGTTYSYTSDNKLAVVQGNNGLAYDPLGRLFNGVIDPGVNTTLLYNGAEVMAETDQNSGALLRRYVYGPNIDEPLIWWEGSGLGDRRWLHADERGSVIAVTNDSGNAIAINAYDEYGIPKAGNIGRFQYTGQKWLPTVGLYDYKARAYSPGLGRFMQTDPIGYGDGMNMYAYVGNNPVNLTDPSGLCPSCIVVTGHPGSDWREREADRWSDWYSDQRDREREIAETGINTDVAVPQNGKPHKYKITYASICPADSVFNHFKKAGNSAPGAPAAREGFTPRIPLTGVFSPNPISQSVNSSTRTIVNTTLQGHVFYPGDVTIQVSPYSNSLGSQITITGTGSGDYPLINDAVGYAWFGSEAMQAADACF